MQTSTGYTLPAMRRLATGLLAFMGALFAASLALEGKISGIEWVRAFSEAALVGGLADWFAVTALFRRPLGLPIPHTAVIPANKERIGRELGQFIRDNFLAEEVLHRKLKSLDAAGKIAHWLEDPALVEKLCERIGIFSAETLQLLDDEKVRHLFKDTLVGVIGRIEAAPAAGHLLDSLLSGSSREQVLDLFFNALEGFLTNQREILSEFIRKEIPWWVPGIVHDKIFQQVFEGIRTTVRGMNRDPEHVLRKRLLENVGTFIQKLKSDKALFDKGEQLKKNVLEHPFTLSYFAAAGWNLKRELSASFSDPQSRTRALLKTLFGMFGSALAGNSEVRKAINEWIDHIVIDLIMAYRNEIAVLISETMDQWDTKTVVDKIESQVGKDLQYIRMNGTLVGGTIGLIIQCVRTLL